jgi:glycosyltransferase involved in cell wall biosynthesis
MSLPKLTVVIPTRERADTLLHTLRTVTEQNYPNLEIIVSDNLSQDNTKDIVESFADKRIKYTSTKNRVGMSSNWEHGLAKVTGDYVMFLGDDDGLLPNACADVAEIIHLTNTKALIWKKPDYNWPSLLQNPNLLSIDISYNLVEMNGKILLWLIANGKISYGLLPVIYSGFVSMQAIRRIKEKSGSFFCSVTPDVYSGIVLAHELNTYLYSMRPFSINGGSHHSNGIASMSVEKKITKLFFSEADIPMHSIIKPIPGSISSCLAEAYLQAYDRGLAGEFKLNKNQYFKLILKELANQPKPIYHEKLLSMQEMDLPKSLRKFIAIELLKEKSISNNTSSEANKKAFKKRVSPALQIDGNQFCFSTVYDCSKFLGLLLGEYKHPDFIHKLTLVSIAITISKRILKKALNQSILPFWK